MKTRTATITIDPTVTSRRRRSMSSGREGRVVEVALEELPDLDVFRVEELLWGTLHDDLPFAQQGKPVGHAEGSTNVMRHHDAGDTQLVVQPLHQTIDD